MKLEFRGVSRQVYTHRHDCTNMRWKSGLESTATIRQVGLSGDFRVTFSFEESDLTNCFQALAASKPEFALRLASKMQAEAVIALSQPRDE
jgi:hypothetical protein